MRRHRASLVRRYGRQPNSTWCQGEGMEGLKLRNHPTLDRCPVCDAVFVRSGPSGHDPIPVHRQGAGDVTV